MSVNYVIIAHNKLSPEAVLTKLSNTYGFTRPQWVNSGNGLVLPGESDLSAQPLPCCIYFGRFKKKKKYLHFLSFLNKIMVQVVKSFHTQCHGHWWPGDARSQDISSHRIDLIILEYSGFIPRRVSIIEALWYSPHEILPENIHCVMYLNIVH